MGQTDRGQCGAIAVVQLPVALQLRTGLAQHLEARIGERAGEPEPRSGFHDAAEDGDKWTAMDRCETVACAEGQGGKIEGRG
jgi:hypothetical protein